MTAPAPLDLAAVLDDLERAQVLAELVAVMHKGWDGSPAVRNWIDEDWERNAEFYLPVVERVRARLIAELCKRDAALRAVLQLADELEGESNVLVLCARDEPGDSLARKYLTGRVTSTQEAVARIRAALASPAPAPQGGQR